ncbi:hypothetical protein G7054_g12833 [Neopestalotiopsis clavispora]|nr:hypothetical protein G7054_g12833 [Neopestalotiopsis clavispora]
MSTITIIDPSVPAQYAGNMNDKLLPNRGRGLHERRLDVRKFAARVEARGKVVAIGRRYLEGFFRSEELVEEGEEEEVDGSKHAEYGNEHENEYIAAAHVWRHLWRGHGRSEFGTKILFVTDAPRRRCYLCSHVSCPWAWPIVPPLTAGRRSAPTKCAALHLAVTYGMCLCSPSSCEECWKSTELRQYHLDGDYFQVGVSLAWIKLNQYCNMGHYTGKRPLWHTVVRGNELMHAVTPSYEDAGFVVWNRLGGNALEPQER